MKTYIKSTSAISPQQTFDKSVYLDEWVNHEEPYLKAQEPVYKGLIDAKMSRRMSRIIKMSVVSAKEVLQEAEVDSPDAIIVGTGLGCIDDTQKFLKNIIDNEEGVLSPTAFIQSTHNTVAGQIALLLQCPNYNFTYTNRGHSFENALVDARMLLSEGMNSVLVGAAEETTQTSYELLQKVGCVGDNDKNPGPLLGEGATFFVLTNEAIDGRPYIQDVDTKSHISVKEAEQALDSFLSKNALQKEDIDAIVLGDNDAVKSDYYSRIRAIFSDDTPVISFKRVSGEHFTASGFALHLAAVMLENQRLFKNTVSSGDQNKKMKNVLVYNNYQEVNHSFMLVSI